MASDANAATTPQAGAVTQPQAGAANENILTPSSDPTATTQPQAGESDAGARESDETDNQKVSISLEEAKKLRSENQNLRKRLKEVDDANLSELDRAKQSAQEASQKALAAQQRLVKYEVAEAARKLGAVNPDLIHKLVKDELEFDDDGMPQNAEKAIRALLKDNPYLANAQAIAGSATNPSRGAQQGGLPIFTMAQVRDLDFYTKNKAAIAQAMKDGRIIG